MKVFDVFQAVWEWRFVIIMLVAVAFKAVSDWKGFKADAYNLMLQAKRQAKDGLLKTGLQQEDWVVRYAYQKLPLSLRLFISEDKLREWIQMLYKKGADILDDGKLNNSI